MAQLVKSLPAMWETQVQSLGGKIRWSREPSVSGNFCGRIKGVKYRVALQGGTWDFPGDTGNFGVPLE